MLCPMYTQEKSNRYDSYPRVLGADPRVSRPDGLREVHHHDPFNRVRGGSHDRGVDDGLPGPLGR